MVENVRLLVIVCVIGEYFGLLLNICVLVSEIGIIVRIVVFMVIMIGCRCLCEFFISVWVWFMLLCCRLLMCLIIMMLLFIIMFISIRMLMKDMILNEVLVI